METAECEESLNIYHNIEYTLAEYYTEMNFLTPRKHTGRHGGCYLRLNTNEQENPMINFTLHLFEIRHQFLQLENGIFCGTPRKSLQCDKVNNLGFYQFYQIKNLSEHFAKLKSINDCESRVFNLLVALINSHNILIEKCNSFGKKREASFIISTLICSVDDFLKKNNIIIDKNA